MSANGEKQPLSGSLHLSITRRDFFKGSAAAALGAAALGSGLRAAETAAELTVNGLPAVVFGRSGLKVTRISFGGILMTEPAVLSHVLDRGINLVHTAPGYMNGRSIEAFGKVLKTRRQETVLATKVMPGKDLDSALKTLNTDYTDFIIPPMDSIEEISRPGLREEFEKARQAGKCGHMGFACHTQSPELIDKMVELGFYGLILMSYADTGNPAFIDSLDRARKAGIGILAMKGLPKRAAGNPTAEERALYATLCGSMVNRLHAHTILASMGSFQAVDMYREILETRLSFHAPNLEESYRAGLDGSYCAMCDNCRGICPNGVAVKDIVRFRMYDRDYRMTAYARTEYAGLAENCRAGACDNCGLCENVCSRHLPLRGMLSEAHARLA
ncbi:MAG: hypothetical protein A2Z86_04390 [Candidatus Glassbacteria bacterium GWA2_58_10]|uniref:NADP-dependent oxidoreductase domain-containing protein n=1 Tax=Candidatus Glassbacteria bacterium GWA2_58_10 TaxID=1817865 RepID=A0A1F5YD15_9BACT|nr:MAG: hypothetical protein A2Z86_04390 [Candidatus Glassbacteria bacterium GWA2_58_10]